MLVAVKRKRNEAVIKLSEKILSSVSEFLLKHNYCKLETPVFNLIGKLVGVKQDFFSSKAWRSK